MPEGDAGPPAGRGPTRLEAGIDRLAGGLAVAGLAVAVGFGAGAMTFLAAALGLHGAGVPADAGLNAAIALGGFAAVVAGVLFARSARHADWARPAPR